MKNLLMVTAMDKCKIVMEKILKTENVSCEMRMTYKRISLASTYYPGLAGGNLGKNRSTPWSLIGRYLPPITSCLTGGKNIGPR